MTNLAKFRFDGQKIRFVGTEEKPEWVAQDICDALGIKKAKDALSDFEPDEKGAVIIQTRGGPQQVLTVKEAGLYRLIMKSRKPKAARFQHWVFREVLPSIFSTGVYKSSTATPSLLS